MNSMPTENNNEVVTPEVVDTITQNTDLSSMFQDSEFEKQGTGAISTQNQDVVPTDVETVTEPIENQETPAEEKIPKPPTRAENESDYQYNSRVEMWQTNQAIKDPETSEEEKSILKKHLNDLRSGLGKDSGKSDTSTVDVQTPVNETFSEEDGAAVIEYLKQQGFMTNDEVQQKIAAVREETIRELRTRQVVEDHGKAISNFYSTRKDIASDPAARQFLEAFVIQNYNVTPETPADKLAIYLDMAASYHYPRQKTITRETKSDVLDVSGAQGASPKVASKGLDDETDKRLRQKGVSMSGFLY